MQIRLIILVAFLAGVIGAYFAVRSRTASQDVPPTETTLDPEQETESIDKIPLSELPLPGEEPDVPPEFHVDVQIDPTGGRNKVILTITEAHGYFAETFRIAWWKKGFERVRFDHYVNDYLEAKGTLVQEIFAVPGELDQIDGELGQTGDWEAEVTEHGRVRLETPENWPPTDDD